MKKGSLKNIKNRDSDSTERKKACILPSLGCSVMIETWRMTGVDVLPAKSGNRKKCDSGNVQKCSRCALCGEGSAAASENSL